MQSCDGMVAARTLSDSTSPMMPSFNDFDPQIEVLCHLRSHTNDKVLDLFLGQSFFFSVSILWIQLESNVIDATTQSRLMSYYGALQMGKSVQMVLEKVK